MTKQDLNYWMMYHEVHHLKRQGCSIRKISEELVLNFRTARKYLSMSEEEFFKHLEVQSQRYKKLILYVSIKSIKSIKSVKLRGGLRRYYITASDVMMRKDK
jgi:hypothetical protein